MARKGAKHKTTKKAAKKAAKKAMRKGSKVKRRTARSPAPAITGSNLWCLTNRIETDADKRIGSWEPQRSYACNSALRNYISTLDFTLSSDGQCPNGEALTRATPR
jgi:hypothetical protein